MRERYWRAVTLVWFAGVTATLLLHIIWPLPGHDAREWAAGLVAFPICSALLLLRRPGNPIGRLLGVVATSAGGIFLAMWVVVVYPRGWSDYVDALAASLVVIHFWGIGALLYLFPTGRAPDRVSHRVFVAFTCWAALMVLWTPFVPGPLSIFNERPNPLGLGPAWLGQVHDAALSGILAGFIGGVVAVVRRHRRAGAVERAQLKWFITGAVLVLALALLIAFSDDPAERAVSRAVDTLIVIGGFWSLPAAIVVAVLRYRLYDIDRLVSRSVTYVLVLAVLATFYLGAIFVLSTLLPWSNDLAVAASTLAAAALFAPLRRRVRGAVDRRFDRTRYDIERELASFVEQLRDQVELEGLRQELAGVVGRTMHPSTLHVWLRDGEAFGRAATDAGAAVASTATR